MIPSDMQGSNVITLAKNQPQYMNLNVIVGEGELTSHWKLEHHELEALLDDPDNGILLTIVGDKHPPVKLTVGKIRNGEF